MSRRMQENLIAAAILVVFVAVIVLSLDYGPRARMIPLPLATIGLIFTIIQIFWQNLRSGDELQVDLMEVLTRQAAKDAMSASGDEPAPRERKSWHKEAFALGIVGLFVGLILLLGPIPAVFLFTGAYFLLSRQYSWLKALVYTVAFTGTLYLLFVVALEVQLYHGVLEPIVSKF
jgi:tripartite tricarboxylate transporter TctB family protein